MYGFVVRSSSDTEKLTEVWAPTAIGGYNRGCLFVVRPHGVLIKGLDNQDDIIPRGTTAWKNGQYATNESSIELMSVTFDLKTLCGAVHSQLDWLGFEY